LFGSGAKPYCTGRTIVTISLAVGPPRVLLLVGIGVKATQAVQIRPPNLRYGERPIDSASVHRIMSVVYTGKFVLVLAKVTSTMPWEFQVTPDGYSGQTVVPGKSCVFFVVFIQAALGQISNSVEDPE